MKDHNKKQPIKNLGDIIRKNAISKKDFISRISQCKNIVLNIIPMYCP